MFQVEKSTKRLFFFKGRNKYLGDIYFDSRKILWWKKSYCADCVAAQPMLDQDDSSRLS